MASAACLDVLPLPPAVDEQQAVSQQQPRLTLAHLLHPEHWDLPEWNGPHVDDPEGIAQKVDVLDHTVALLKRYRNSLRPIHRLSPDILALIFLSLVEEDAHPLSSQFGAASWTYLAHVCYRWRAIALGCGALWTQLSTRYPEAALACLERSGDAPLSFVLHARATSGDSKEVVDRVRSHMNRMRRLYIPWTHIHDEDGNMSELVSLLIEAPAPQLETFYVYRVRAEGDCFALPTVFGGQTPRLRVLKLSYSYPQIGRVSFGNLRELYIRGKKRDLITMEVSRLLEILEACPALEIFVTIKARFIMSAPLDHDDEPLRQIRLDNLRRIDISRCSAFVGASLLRRLIVPNCQLSMSVWLERRTDFRFIFGVPDELCDEHPLRDIRRLHVSYRSAGGSVLIEGVTSAHPFQIVASIDSNTAIGDMPTVSGQILLSIARTLDLSLLEEFTISETSFYHPHVGFSKELWTQVLARMPLLRKLHIRLQTITDSGFCRVVLSALSTADEVTGRLPCPHLETVTLVEDRTWSSLQWYKFAKARKEQGHPLRRLSLCLPHYENVEDMAETDLAELREVVETVDLDPPQETQIELPAAVW
ncbi:hypothetical protein PYCCODRAFT_1429644 [Trametes coccinea BRFM310]|uniref:Uncharacterized protein n=1 Tax=Trametes coccinea (strain BRFM310) TaxID=1353009 RepID=A0A1Y2J7Z1_TRAC3|nr:hypothetical protein PYCCODRAFT_1429644 [Trametes coccinea BRFM310]